MKTQQKNKGLMQELEIPNGVIVETGKDEITIKKDNKSTTKNITGIKAEKKENKIILTTTKTAKKDRKLIMTYKAHIANAIKGLSKEFLYKLKVCAVHFPMTVTVDKNNNALVIKNFLGEKKERRAKILPHVEVQIKGDEIIVTSFNIENAGQTAANIETATTVKYRDRRVFQDGIFLTERRGEKI